MNINFKRVMLASLAAGAVLSSLSACAPLMVGGAVMGSLVAIDRRTTGIQIEDEGIELRTAQGLRQAPNSQLYPSREQIQRQFGTTHRLILQPEVFS
jgi:osmotically-inducible protein OsmY